MSVTLQELETNGAIFVLASCFDSEASAIALLSKLNVEHVFFAKFGDPSMIDWWRVVCRKLEQGMGGEDALKRLMESAADVFRGNPIFAAYCNTKASQAHRNIQGINFELRISGNIPADTLLSLTNAIGTITQAKGGEALVNLGYPGSTCLEVTFDKLSEEQVQEVLEEFRTTCEERGASAEFTQRSYHFRDYYSDPITLEGPDGQQFAADQIRASTTVSDLARGLMGQYADQGIWPTRKDQKTQAVIDKVGADGSPSQRLDPRLTLHDAGVRPGDTLRISPERTAGAIDPMLREAALARVRNEVLAYAESHPGFEVEANSLVAPTEYLFRFSVPGFAPPGTEGGTPKRIDYHEVLVELPPDFPIKAPQAWWQTDIYHANIDFKSGKVCLGALQEHYRPAMDFGELCQMLVDLAGYRNYTVTEGYNAEAAQWATTPEGQRAIESVGGISLLGRMGMDGAAEKPFKIRKIQP